MFLRGLAALAALSIPAALIAQTPVSISDSYQINYASNLNLGDGVVNLTNAGSSGGSICANIYVYTPDEELASCCSCLASPNSLHAWPVSFGPGNLLTYVNNTGQIGTHNVVLKLVATIPGAGGTCDPTSSTTVLASGLAAWATHSHPTNTSTVAITETPFIEKSLSTFERGKLTGDCNAELTQFSGRQCPGCLTGGLAVPAPTL